MMMTVLVVLVMTVATVMATKGADRRQARGVTTSAERPGWSRGPPVEQVLVIRMCWKAVPIVAVNNFLLFRRLMTITDGSNLQPRSIRCWIPEDFDNQSMMALIVTMKKALMKM